MDKFTLIYNALNDCWAILKKYRNIDMSKEEPWAELMSEFEQLKQKYATYNSEELISGLFETIFRYLEKENLVQSCGGD